MNGTALLFLLFVAAVAGVVAWIAAWRLPRSVALRIAVALAAWLAYVAALSASGLIAEVRRRPPAVLAIVVPVVLFVAFAVVRSRGAGRIARAVPPWILIALQVDRIGVELFLHDLWVQGLVPRMLTYRGANVDLWFGLTAPLVAWLSTRGAAGVRIALVWNGVGLLSLANVIVRSALTSPGPMHLLDTEVLNRAIGTFPYTFIAGFLAPLAVTLHVLSLRAGGARSVHPGPSKGLAA